MGGSRLVEVEVGEQRPRGDLGGEKVVEHEHIRLLENLRAGCPLRTEQHVGGDRSPRRDLFDHQRLEGEEAGELLIDAACLVVAVDERLGDRQPARTLPLIATVERGGTTQVPACEDVREGVVIDRLVVLVGSDHAVDVGLSVGADADARGPIAGGFRKELPRRAGREFLIGSPVEITGCRPGDIADDVLLELTGSDRHGLARRQLPVSRRDVAPVSGRLPGEASARPSCSAACRAAGSRRSRYSSIARAADGWVAARKGSTKTSLSQKTWPW